MISCRFDNSIDGESTLFEGFVQKIEAFDISELPSAFIAIERLRQQGRWIALVIPYAFGELLEPRLAVGAKPEPGEPILIALAFAQSRKVELPEQLNPVSIGPSRPEISFAAYEKNLKKIKRWLQEGNVYQINYTFPLAVELNGDPADFYAQTIRRHPTSFASHIKIGEKDVLSFSPELFLEKKKSTISTKPMKGTAPRCASPEEDHQSYLSLKNSEKNRAENTMIVDLLRNDLGKIAKPGSVQVDKLLEIEKYRSVWTMTSTINADVGDATLPEILGAMFPCGSVTGAPKIAAMQYIQELEPHPRGLYCGSIGWLAPDGDLLLNVAIRTLVVEGGAGVYGVGGGIVLDSDPAEEWLECQWKTRILSEDFSNWH